MKILVTGSTGYIGKRLIPLLLKQGHEIIACVRDLNRVSESFKNHPRVKLFEVDFINPGRTPLPIKIDVSYYLIHSMSSSSGDFKNLEELCAINFRHALEKTNAKQLIYLGGIVNNTTLSKHLSSRKNVENHLKSEIYSTTVFRAGIIVGSGSASFEIIRDLVEKLPVMITPKWLNTKSHPIAIGDVLKFLIKAAENELIYNKTYDIFGKDLLTYKQMLMIYAQIRGLKRTIITLPVLTPKISSYWLYFVTSTSFHLASTLVNSMKVEVIGSESDIEEILDVQTLSYIEAVEKAFLKIKQNSIASSWSDAFASGRFNLKVSDYIEVPQFGCYVDHRKIMVKNIPKAINNIWKIGGNNGWYYGDNLWKFRGIIDKVLGGVGLRRGRRHPFELEAGDSLDFWRVILADKENGRLLLYAEMKLPGEAWLEFELKDRFLHQKAVFRPRGLMGRFYWLLMKPVHYFIFRKMLERIAH